MPERRKLNRRKISYYMPLIDMDNGQIFGHLADISPKGLLIDSPHDVPIGRQYHLQLETSADVSDTQSIEFVVVTKWGQPDWIEPNLYNVGLEIVQVNPHDANVLQQILEKYGS